MAGSHSTWSQMAGSQEEAAPIIPQSAVNKADTSKFKFKQMGIREYLSSKNTVDFETKMKTLETERLVGLKRLKDLEWKDRKSVEFLWSGPKE